MENTNRLRSLNTLSKDDMSQIPRVDKMLSALKDIYSEAHSEIEKDLDRIVRVVWNNSSSELFLERLRDVKMRLTDLLFQCKTTTEIKKILVVGYALAVIKNEIKSIGEDIKIEMQNNKSLKDAVHSEYLTINPCWV